MDDDYDSFEDSEIVMASQDEAASDGRKKGSKSARNSEPPEAMPEEEAKPDPENDTLVIEKPDEDVPTSDIIKILVATDIHCGYAENKPVRNLDSVNTFEEVLQIGVEKKVDMILLGGDLFHDNNPSRDVQHRVVQLLRQYCLNDREVSLEFLSDPSVNFSQSRFGRVNYYDPNLNVGMPIFTIHGNHDDLSGKGLTALDLLHESGLVNLFGKYDNIEKFDVSPILLRKGQTRLALYGIGSQRDDRLCRAFQKENICFLRPQSGAEDWFNILTLHQNRPQRAAHRSTGAYLPEQFIPSFFDLVVWGHEHECKPDPQYVASTDIAGNGFYVLQPGSTVATSLTEDEAKPKNVFLIKVRGRKFSSKPIPLKTTRQDELAIEEKLNAMIEAAAASRGPRQPTLPLIRLKVTYADEWAKIQPVNARRIGARYDDVVANALDMIVVKKKGERKPRKVVGGHLADEPLGNVSASNLQHVIAAHFAQAPFDDRLTVLNEIQIGRALEFYSENDAENAPKTAVAANRDFANALKAQVELVKGKLEQMEMPQMELLDDDTVDFGKFDEMIRRDLHNMKKHFYEQEAGPMYHDDTSMFDDDVTGANTTATTSKANRSTTRRAPNRGPKFDDDDDDDDIVAVPSRRDVVGQNRRAVDVDDDDDDIQVIAEPPTQRATRGRPKKNVTSTTRSVAGSQKSTSGRRDVDEFF